MCPRNSNRQEYFSRSFTFSIIFCRSFSTPLDLRIHPRCRPMGRRVGSCFLPRSVRRHPGDRGSSKITVQSLRKLIYILGNSNMGIIVNILSFTKLDWPCLEITAHSQRILESCLALMEELICVICAAKRGIYIFHYSNLIPLLLGFFHYSI